MRQHPVYFFAHPNLPALLPAGKPAGREIDERSFGYAQDKKGAPVNIFRRFYFSLRMKGYLWVSRVITAINTT